MGKLTLEFGAVLLSGAVGASSGVTGPVEGSGTGLTFGSIATEANWHGTVIRAETCSVCVSNCYRIYELLSQECADKRKYRTRAAQALCRAMASEEHGRCLKQCNHE